ncbi:hypothetical protein F5Y06DRAFT_306529 [Hypoxylon sp. FL0890]|nr:hypothetical protein F5Y06DRAFT_306529 [Hypoxylon sp. FL0890]
MKFTDSFRVLALTALLAFPRIVGAIVDDCTGAVVSEALPALIDSASILKHLQSLQKIADQSYGNRLTGSDGHNRTIDYIKDELSSLGYYVEVQHFEGLMQVQSKAALVVNDHFFQVEPIGWSPSARLADLPVRGDGCTAAQYPPEALGAVVLVAGGGCSFSEKSIAAGKAGADVLLLHESTQLTPSMGSLNPLHIPSARIPERDARRILNHNRPLWVNAAIILTKHEHEYGDEENTLLVGTHTDSVSTSAGINDNASGIASLLEVAAKLARFKTNSRVKFAFWTASEPCLLGSRHFVNASHPEELQKIRLYLDVNMIGSSNGAFKIYGANRNTPRTTMTDMPLGSEHASETLADGFAAQNVRFRTTLISNRSDYALFFDANIPFSGLFSGADGLKVAEEAQIFGGVAGLPYDSRYHEPDDDLENINMTMLLLNTKVLAHAVGVYGNSFDGLSRGSAAWRYEAANPSLLILAWMTCCLLAYSM